jgi:hypothetical protein
MSVKRLIRKLPALPDPDDYVFIQGMREWLAHWPEGRPSVPIQIESLRRLLALARPGPLGITTGLVIVVDGHDVKVPPIRYPYEHKPPAGKHWMTGAMIKAASGTPTSNSLYRESETSCDEPDDFIGDGALLVIEGGERFHTVPPATF